MGYHRGSPDLIIQNLHKKYTGFVIEFKSPKGIGVLCENQAILLQEYSNNGYKVLVSNDYEEIVKNIILYFIDTRLVCDKEIILYITIVWKIKEKLEALFIPKKN